MFSKLLYHANPKAPLGDRLCVLAAEKIQKGEILLKEAPFLAAHTVNCADRVPPHVVSPHAFFYDNVPLDRAILARLKEDSGQKLRTYAAMCGAEDFLGSDDGELAFIRTALLRNVTPGVEVCYGAALYKQAVYFNHACDGGARLFFTVEQRVVVVAQRDFEKGEEVCLQYVPFLRGDCAAFHLPGALTLDFVCECARCEAVINDQGEHCEMVEKKAPRLSLYSFEMPLLQSLVRESETDAAVDLECRILNRCVRQLMITVQDLGFYEKNYKVAQLMMRQKSAWKAFVKHAPGPLLVHLGLNLARCALLACKGGPAGECATVRNAQKFSTLNDFWQQWNVVLSTADHGADAPHAFRYGVLLHTLLAKFFKLTLGKATKDFFHVFRSLLTYMGGELYVRENDAIMHLLCFHLDLLGWVDIIGFIEQVLNDNNCGDKKEFLKKISNSIFFIRWPRHFQPRIA